MLSKKKKARWEQRQLKIAEQSQEMSDAMEVEVVTAKEDFNKAVIEAWNSSDKLIPYEPLIKFMTHCFRVQSYDATVARYIFFRKIFQLF